MQRKDCAEDIPGFEGDSEILHFEVRSGTMIVADPCYTNQNFGMPRDFALALVNIPAQIGTWFAQTYHQGGNTLRVVVWLPQALKPLLPWQWRNEVEEGGENLTLLWPWEDNLRAEKGLVEIAVDSGQMYVGDAARPRDANNPAQADWYEQVCKLVQEHGTSVVNDGMLIDPQRDPIGVVCQTGRGDGMYITKVINDPDGYVVAVQVTFLDREDDIEDLDNDEEEEDEDDVLY